MAQQTTSPPAGRPPSSRIEDDGVRWLVIVGLASVLALFGGVGGWAATFKLAGAVIAGGTVVVESDVKKVQHPSGGVVGEIKVKDGDEVVEGQLLMRLDETITRANLHVVVNQLDELAIRQARLAAERGGAETVTIPADLAARRNEPAVDAIVTGEIELFKSRRSGRAGQKSQLGERILQLRKEASGHDAQLVAKGREIELVKIELEGQDKLWQQKLIPITKYTAMQREATRLGGERGQLTAAKAQAEGKIAETELQILQIDHDMRTEVMKDLREVQAKVAELTERRIAAEDQLRRVEIRSPRAGIVHQMTVHTIGGVITTGEPVMLIVPKGDELEIEVKISPQDIDRVHVGQAALVRFTAFNQRTTPEVTGQISRLSADLTKETQTGQMYFTARIKLTAEQLKPLGSNRLLPGMPAEVHIQTTERTAMSYLLKPLTDQIARTFKEQ